MTSPRGYSVAQICEKLPIARRTFFDLKKRGLLPFLEELRPRVGRCLRFRAELIDRYLENRWAEKPLRRVS